MATAIVTVTSNGAKPVMLAMASEEALSLAVVAKRLEAARNGLSPETGSSVYRLAEPIGYWNGLGILAAGGYLGEVDHVA